MVALLKASFLLMEIFFFMIMIYNIEKISHYMQRTH